MNISSTPGLMQIAAGSIRKSVNSLAADAHIVANSADVTSGRTVEALIDARQQVLYTKAGARMISAADEMISSLLDVHA
jgi:hypothetical protein